MLNLRKVLLDLADAYQREVDDNGGRSLARVATIAVNRGAFFDRLRLGKTCTLPSFEAFINWFAEPSNWPAGEIPPDAKAILELLPITPCQTVA